MQVAKAQGQYLAKLFSTYNIKASEPLPPDARPFNYIHKGSMAYVSKVRQQNNRLGGEQGVAWST